jgi:uncharacterized repeat protein (TIGR03837 family)
LNQQKQRWDIFCRIVDNFGDIGVCWRLAKQLSAEYGLDVRLWIDDLAGARRLLPSLDLGTAHQRLENIDICHWQAGFSFDRVADVVIEAFACELPENYLLAMAETQPVWLNLEYLSAESWVEQYHLQPSPHPRLPLKKTFFFPGFTQKTGGLLRERGLLAERDVFQHQRAADTVTGKHAALRVSLFCYPFAPVRQLLTCMAQSARPVECVIPQTGIMDEVCGFFGANAALTAGQQRKTGNLTVKILPFLSQAEYDRLLWSCDLNFVRGEDSWIRAIWAGRPFIWQPYRQEDDAHFVKLDAFLDRYLKADDGLEACELSAGEALATFQHAWSRGSLQPHHWQQLMQYLPALDSHAQRRSEGWAELPDLAAKLVIFCRNSL